METLGWGLVGCGEVADKRVARALREAPQSTLVAVSRARADLAADFASRHSARRWYADWREVLKDPEVQAVYVATPVGLHAEQAVAAAEAGRHVLCEKPMALDVASCERMVDAARRNGVRLGVAYYRHHYPVVARVRSLLKEGVLGEPVLVQAQAFEGFDPPEGHPRRWLLNKSQSGGGPMFDFGCHRLEVLLDLLGPVAEVRGFTTNARYRDREVEDTAVAHLRFASGAQGLVSVSHAPREARDTLEVYGSHGSAHVAVLNSGVLRIVTEGGESTETLPPHANLHQPLVDDFVAAVKENRAPAVSGEVGLAVSRLLETLYG